MTVPGCRRGKIGATATFVASAALLAGCGSSHNVPGPVVVGMSLNQAEHVLSERQLGFLENLESGPLSPASNPQAMRVGWVVCSETYVNRTMVQLNTKKTSC